jgi:hypothetical protein
MAFERNGKGLAILAALALTGCGLIPPGTEPEPTQSAAAGPAPAITPAPAMSPVPKPPPPKPAPPGARAGETAEPVKLIGLDRAAAHELLGQPEAQSDAGSAKVWTYRSGTCQLEVFFSYDLARADFYVLSYSVNRGSGSSDVERQCLTRLAHDRNR